MMFAGFILVIIEREPPSVPSRTRQGNPVSPMVLWLKPRQSRSSPESIQYHHLLPRLWVTDVKTEFHRPLGGFLFVCCSGCVIIPHKGKIMTNEEIIAKINKILTKVHDVFNQRHKHNRPISDTATRTNNIKTTECFMRLCHYEPRSKR